MIDSINSLDKSYFIKQKLEDFEILKEVIDGSIDIEDLGEDLKERLIQLCREQIEAVESKIGEIEEETEKLKAFLY